VNRLKNLTKYFKTQQSITNTIRNDLNIIQKSAGISIQAVSKEQINEPMNHNVYDLIGPADKISNLRRISYYVPKNESKLEYDYRMLRKKVFEFNQNYWTQQNLKFVDAKRKYIQNHKIEQVYFNKNLEDANEPLLNEFYKKFLDENYESHYEYNKTWIKYNLSLIWPGTKVFIYRLLFKKLR
jgi:hypothetical protein